MSNRATYPARGSTRPRNSLEAAALLADRQRGPRSGFRCTGRAGPVEFFPALPVALQGNSPIQSRPLPGASVPARPDPLAHAVRRGRHRDHRIDQLTDRRRTGSRVAPGPARCSATHVVRPGPSVAVANVTCPNTVAESPSRPAHDLARCSSSARAPTCSAPSPDRSPAPVHPGLVRPGVIRRPGSRRTAAVGPAPGAGTFVRTTPRGFSRYGAGTGHVDVRAAEPRRPAGCCGRDGPECSTQSIRSKTSCGSVSGPPGVQVKPGSPPGPGARRGRSRRTPRRRSAALDRPATG